MSENLHLVFSKPPEAISDEEYNRWYDFHLGEILVVPGFVSARRYRLQTVKGEWTPSGYRHPSAYEIEGDPRDVMPRARQGGRVRPDATAGLVSGQITFASFNCHSHGNPAEARLAEHLYLVFSAPPKVSATTSSSPGTASTPTRTRRYPASWPTGGSASSPR